MALVVEREDILFGAPGSQGAIALPLPDFPVKAGDDLTQINIATMGKRVVTVSRIEFLRDNPVLIWNDMLEDEYERLKTFIEQTARGSANPFEYTDYANRVRQVKYLSGLPGQHVRYDGVLVELRLAGV